MRTTPAARSIDQPSRLDIRPSLRIKPPSTTYNGIEICLTEATAATFAPI